MSLKIDQVGTPDPTSDPSSFHLRLSRCSGSGIRSRADSQNYIFEPHRTLKHQLSDKEQSKWSRRCQYVALQTSGDAKNHAPTRWTRS